MGVDELTDANTSAFDLHRHPTKAAPALIHDDERHFLAIAKSLQGTIADHQDRLDVVRRQPGGSGQEALDRDLEIHRLSARLNALRRYRLDLCLGRMAFETGEIVYVGRFGLTDPDGRRLLVDWRSPAAEPFFAATAAHPMGLVSKRRYRWTDGRITDYWDESFDPTQPSQKAALDDQSAFIASLGASRTEQMRDVLATLQADQDAIIRADSHGALVVDGGPGTGKTVVALHRAAYLLYADPRLSAGRGGVLVVGPHDPYLAYVADVLPSLGEEGVLTCTVRNLVPEGRTAHDETDSEVARLKTSVAMVEAVEAAVRVYEEVPTEGLEVETDWAELWLSPVDWAEAFNAPDPGTPHNEARDHIWDALLDILVDKHRDATGDDGPTDDQVRRSLRRSAALVEAVTKAWPTLEAADLVGDLWEVPAYLRHCAPHLAPEEVRLLRRTAPQVWTTADLPLLDAARLRLGDPDAPRSRRRQEAQQAAERAEMDDVVDHLIASDDSDMMIMSMLRGSDLRGALAAPATHQDTADRYAGPFAHIIVDEAQELTDAEWQMLVNRCPSRSFTVVGDRAQARHGFAESWSERLTRVGLRDVEIARLSVNYRTPAEVMVTAAPVIRAVLPDANVPTSIRETGNPVRHDDASRLDEIVETWLAAHDEGTACVIGEPGFAATERVRSLTPELAKGLEFDLVVLVRPDAFGDPTDPIRSAVDRYVAMTRATQELVILD